MLPKPPLDECMIGSGDDCLVVLDDPRVSRRHARLKREARYGRSAISGARTGSWRMAFVATASSSSLASRSGSVARRWSPRARGQSRSGAYCAHDLHEHPPRRGTAGHDTDRAFKLDRTKKATGRGTSLTAAHRQWHRPWRCDAHPSFDLTSKGAAAICIGKGMLPCATPNNRRVCRPSTARTVARTGRC
jgi:hypothetical protein